MLRVVTVRARRHDERVWAGWVNGAFDTGMYLAGGAPIERLGWARITGKRKVPLKQRGVLDVIEGIRGPRQWIEHFEAQDLARAVGLISAAFVVR